MSWKKGYGVFILSLFFLIGCALLFIPFMKMHQEKIGNGEGWIFADPVLALIPGKDLSVFIFSITYGAILSFCVTYYRDYRRLSQVAVGYSMILLLRMASMSLVPLKEPAGLIPLEDPFLNQLIYPGNITSDLFFSGHVAIVSLIGFVSKHTAYYLIAAIVLALMLLVQHIHYSIDVLAAIPVAFLVALFVRKLPFFKSVKDNS